MDCTTPPVGSTDLKAAHKNWLTGQEKQLSPALAEEWSTCEDWDGQVEQDGLLNYTALGAKPLILWRFTSNPETEFIKITSGQSLPKIVKVIGEHSGGANKSDPDVITSSLCRNIGALMGTAACTGGDKKVLNIINKAAYLVGIDVSLLADWGVSAHPALCRTISVVETEYVLVRTPGLPSLTLSELATIRMPNPFLGCINHDGTVRGSEEKLLINPTDFYAKLFSQDPEKPGNCIITAEMASGFRQRILKFAAAYSRAADTQSLLIATKDPARYRKISIAVVSKILAEPKMIEVLDELERS